MGNILEEIIAYKRVEVKERKDLVPIKLLEKSTFFQTPTVSLKEYILREDKSGIIAEIKKQSPSAGVINSNVSIERISIGYMQAGASALSILTDNHFFGGSNEDLTTARIFNFCPILRKDFVIDEYQIIEAKSIGADAILLIAAVLKENELKRLATFAKTLGLEVLVEVHNRSEIYKSLDDVDLVGVNNRDLTSFDVSIDTSLELFEHLPDGVAKISESGISTPEAVHKLLATGYRGFLIGESFMKENRPEDACRRFVQKVKVRIPT